jgi:hypothetical protein
VWRRESAPGDQLGHFATLPGPCPARCLTYLQGCQIADYLWVCGLGHTRGVEHRSASSGAASAPPGDRPAARGDGDQDHAPDGRQAGSSVNRFALMLARRLPRLIGWRRDDLPGHRRPAPPGRRRAGVLIRSRRWWQPVGTRGSAVSRPGRLVSGRGRQDAAGGQPGLSSGASDQSGMPAGALGASDVPQLN